MAQSSAREMANQLALEAEEAVAEENWRSATNLFTSAIELDPSQPDYFVGRAAVYLQRKVYDLALADAENVIRMDPLNPLGYHFKGDVYFQQSEYGVAVSTYRQGLARCPENPALHFRVYECLDAAAAAGNLVDTDLRALIGRADEAFTAEDHRKAIRLYSEAIEQNPDNAELYRKRSASKVYRGHFNSALKDARKVLELLPSSPDAYRELGSIHHRMQNFDLAEDAFKQGLAYEPGNSALLQSLTRVERVRHANAQGAQTHHKEMQLQRQALVYSPYDGPVEQFCQDNYPELHCGAGQPGGFPIKMAITVTLYNETGDELMRTLKGISESYIEDMPWQSVVTVVVCDGHSKINEDMKGVAEQMGLFDPSLIDYTKLDRTTMHLFETNLVTLETDKSPKRMQVLFCLKEKNGGKLNSHSWFFHACKHSLHPTYVFLIDVGTVPEVTALGRLYQGMEEDPQLGGVCGEIAVDELKLTSVVQCAQHYEYKISHIMEKSMESMMGFVSVLPGAFSAYRYCAINGAPLKAYFRMEHGTADEVEEVKSSAFLSNMYLAEDRIMAFELLVKEDCDWTLAYLTGAVAYTDVPETIVALTKQRRRWMNGSFFAGLYVLKNWRRLFKSGHHPLRQLVLLYEFFYTGVGVVVGWLALGNSFLALMIGTNLAFEGWGIDRYVYNIYMCLIMIQVLYAIGNRPDSILGIYKALSILFGIMMFFAAVSLIRAVFIGNIFEKEIIALTSFVGAAVYSSFIFGETWSLMKVFGHYLLLAPTFTNTFTIFAFCNIHDVSWGTRPPSAHGGGDGGKGVAGNGPGGALVYDNEEKRQLREIALKRERAEARRLADEAALRAVRFSRFRTYLMVFWLITQISYLSVMVNIWHTPFFSWWIISIAAFVMSTRLIGCTLYQLRAAYRAFYFLTTGVRYRGKHSPKHPHENVFGEEEGPTAQETTAADLQALISGAEAGNAEFDHAPESDPEKGEEEEAVEGAAQATEGQSQQLPVEHPSVAYAASEQGAAESKELAADDVAIVMSTSHSTRVDSGAAAPEEGQSANQRSGEPNTPPTSQGERLQRRQQPGGSVKSHGTVLLAPTRRSTFRTSRSSIGSITGFADSSSSHSSSSDSEEGPERSNSPSTDSPAGYRVGTRLSSGGDRGEGSESPEAPVVTEIGDSIMPPPDPAASLPFESNIESATPQLPFERSTESATPQLNPAASLPFESNIESATPQLNPAASLSFDSNTESATPQLNPAASLPFESSSTEIATPPPDFAASPPFESSSTEIATPPPDFAASPPFGSSSTEIATPPPDFAITPFDESGSVAAAESATSPEGPAATSLDAASSSGTIHFGASSPSTSLPLATGISGNFSDDDLPSFEFAGGAPPNLGFVGGDFEPNAGTGMVPLLDLGMLSGSEEEECE